jgi:hypothetical protein
VAAVLAGPLRRLDEGWREVDERLLRCTASSAGLLWLGLLLLLLLLLLGLGLAGYGWIVLLC